MKKLCAIVDDGYSTGKFYPQYFKDLRFQCLELF